MFGICANVCTQLIFLSPFPTKIAVFSSLSTTLPCFSLSNLSPIRSRQINVHSLLIRHRSEYQFVTSPVFFEDNRQLGKIPDRLTARYIPSQKTFHCNEKRIPSLIIALPGFAARYTIGNTPLPTCCGSKSTGAGR